VSGRRAKGLWPTAPCDVTEVGYEPPRVRRIHHMGYLCMPGGHFWARTA